MRPLDECVLFIGRGGSGTRLLSQLAVDAGIFVGNRVNKSGDSKEWIDLIYRMAVETGKERELPTGSRYRREIRATADQILAAAPSGQPDRWGLKLPEAMLVLPLLVDAYPQAKVVHLVRHPIPSSLRRSHMTSRLGNRVGNVALRAAYAYAGQDPARVKTDEVFLHNAYSWDHQVARVVGYARKQLPGTQYLELKYEAVCRDPDHAFSTLQTFLGRAEDDTRTSLPVDHSRSGEWEPDDPRAHVVWDICGNTAEKIGYMRDRAE
jgi:hypothetical protein